MSSQNAVAKTEAAGNAVTPMDLLAQAVAAGTASPETLEKLMSMYERWDKGQARKAFDEAIASAKAEIPVIIKSATGHNNKLYANFAAIAKVIDPIISKHGLSYRFRTMQDERIHVTCVMSHAAGHSEETTLAGPADQTGNKNAIQAIGSTLTYLQRYSLVQALGLAAAEDDDGRKGGVGPTISEEQVQELNLLLTQEKIPTAAFFKVFNITALPDLLASSFDDAKAEIAKVVSIRAKTKERVS